MYYYIVDPQKISQKEFERVQSILYSSLSEFKISGEVVRVTGLRTIQQLVENAFAHEVKTIVAVGTDETLHDVINAIAKREVVIGYIPLVDTELGQFFGLKDIAQSAKTIAARRIQELDLGAVNNNYFLSKLTFGLTDNRIQTLFNLPQFEVRFSVNGEYDATQKVVAGTIINSRMNSGESNILGNPTDKILDVVLLPELGKWEALRYRRQILDGFFENLKDVSIIHVSKIEIISPTGLPLKMGDRVVARTPALISVIPKMLKMIVGKNRNF